MNRNDAIKALIEHLNSQRRLTDLEKDILDTLNEINKDHFDRTSAENKIRSNNISYPDLFAVMGAVAAAGAIPLPLPKLSDDDIKNNLQLQFELLCAKRLGGNQ